jgi:hypothetical protein
MTNTFVYSTLHHTFGAKAHLFTMMGIARQRTVAAGRLTVTPRGSNLSPSREAVTGIFRFIGDNSRSI